MQVILHTIVSIELSAYFEVLALASLGAAWVCAAMACAKRDGL